MLLNPLKPYRGLELCNITVVVTVESLLPGG